MQQVVGPSCWLLGAQCTAPLQVCWPYITCLCEHVRHAARCKHASHWLGRLISPWPSLEPQPLYPSAIPADVPTLLCHTLGVVPNLQGLASPADPELMQRLTSTAALYFISRHMPLTPQQRALQASKHTAQMKAHVAVSLRAACHCSRPCCFL